MKLRVVFKEWKTWHIAFVTAAGATTLALAGVALTAPPKTAPARAPAVASPAPPPEVLTMAPTPPPASHPAVAVTSSPAPPPATTGPVATEGGGGDTEVYYATCAAAKQAGAAPLYRGDPGYRAKLDRDGDGIACES